MRLATYNVENMFERARAMDLATWAECKPIFEDYQRLNTLIQESVDTPVIKDELLTILKRHVGLISQPESRSLILRAICGEFVKQPRNTPAEIVANGRSRQGRGSERRVCGVAQRAHSFRIWRPSRNPWTRYWITPCCGLTWVYSGSGQAPFGDIQSLRSCLEMSISAAPEMPMRSRRTPDTTCCVATCGIGLRLSWPLCSLGNPIPRTVRKCWSARLLIDPIDTSAS